MTTWWWTERWDDWRVPGRAVRISWDGGTAVADLFDGRVPNTSAALLAALPVTVPVVHAAWSGDMVMSAAPVPICQEEAENYVRLPRTGDLGWDPRCGELTVTYGTAECRLPSGENAITVFGAIREGLSDFAAFGRARRFAGVGELLIEPIDSTTPAPALDGGRNRPQGGQQ